MAEGKWITGLTPATPLAVAARQVLEARLQVVAHYLPLAIEQAHADIEHVHQLRVATRRARAAIDLFARCLTSEGYERLRQQLRRVRRGAGDARDWDVFFLSIEDQLKRAKAKTAPGLHWLAGQALANRVVAQERLEELRKHKVENLEAALGEALDFTTQAAGSNGANVTLGQVAPAQIAALVEALETAATGDLHDYGQLHQVRIEGKRLRYAMEIYAECFPPDFRQKLYPVVEEMQEILGLANDSHVAGQRLTEMEQQGRAYQPDGWRLWRDGVKDFQRFHRQQLARSKAKFLRFWKRWRQRDVGKRLKALVPAGSTVPASKKSRSSKPSTR